MNGFVYAHIELVVGGSTKIIMFITRFLSLVDQYAYQLTLYSGWCSEAHQKYIKSLSYSSSDHKNINVHVDNYQ